jgi:nuclear protein localization family protein 4
MNPAAVSRFIGHWEKSGCLEQRMTHLYGYYSEDPNYKEGIRAVCEVLYDPPQMSDMSGQTELQDKRRNQVDRIAHALGLEHIGLMFTKMDQDTVLSEKEIRRAARMQNDYMFDHPFGCKVSKQVTVVVKKDPQGQTDINAYMVSDLAQAMERDGVFGESKDRKMMCIRESTKEHDLVPAVLQQGNRLKEFDQDFFIVNVNNG